MIPEIQRSELEPMYDMDYWDGPLTGIAYYRGRQHYFTMQKDRPYVGDPDDDDDDEKGYGWLPRLYSVHSLTDEQIAELNWRNDFFLRDKEAWYAWREDNPLSFDLTLLPVVGWFHE